MNNISSSVNNKKFFIKELIQFTIIIFTISSLLVFSYLKLKTKEQIDILKTEELYNLKILKNRIEQHIYSASSDLLSLSHQSCAINSILSGNKSTYDIIKNGYISMAKYKEIYDQVRFLDTLGNEVLRINYNYGVPTTTPKDKLQNKKNRYYFKNSINLNISNVYMSPLDLNMENGKIEQPLKPMIRFATPVWFNNKKLGILILNYSANKILQSISSNKNNSLGSLYLTNNKGQYLFSPDKNKNWGNMYPKRSKYSLKKEYSKEWGKMLKQKEGQIETKNGIFSFFIIDSRSLTTNDISFKTNKTYFLLVSKIIPKIVLNNLNIYNTNDVIIIVFILSLIIALIIAHFSSQKKIIQKTLINRENQLSELNKTKDTLFSIISHDLRGPIGNIANALNLLNSGILTREDADEFLKKLGFSIKTTQALLENLLNWAKNQKEGISLNKTQFNFYSIIKDVIEILTPLAEKKNINLIIETDEGTIINADKNMLQLIIRNLISNSIKFTNYNGKITIKVSSDENNLYLNITDNGIGMSQETMDKIFDRNYFITTNGTNHEKGSGLGLKLCYDFVKAHNGDILVESEINKGTNFKIIIPQ